MKTLKKMYVEKVSREEKQLHEGILDAFASKSENTQKVKSSLQQAKAVSQTFGMKNIMAAINTAEQKFEQAIANDKMTNRAVAISNIVTFSDVIAEFFRTLDEWVMQLPSMATALEAAKNPENAQKTLQELVGAQGDKVSPVLTVTKIIEKQFQKSAGGFFKTLGRFFKSGAISTADSALKFVGLDAQKAAEDIMNVQAGKYNQLKQAGGQVPAVQIDVQAGTTPQSGSIKSSETTASQQSTSSTPSQQAVPAGSSEKTQGNVQLAKKPSPEEAEKRNTQLQSVVKNRNAFNPQYLGTLSNEEIKSDLVNIAKSLGIDLTK